MIQKTKLFAILAFILTLSATSFFLKDNGSASIGETDPCSYPTETQYRCADDKCGTTILRRSRTCTSCPGAPLWCPNWGPEHESNYKTLESWLRCDSEGTQWQWSEPSYNCRGNCLQKPDAPQYNGGNSNNNVNLPVRMSWKNVDGFGNRDRKGPASYRLTINNTNTEPGGENFDFAHDFGNEEEEKEEEKAPKGEFPLWSTLPDIGLSEASSERKFFKNAAGEYRFIRPTSHEIRGITSCFGMRRAWWREPPEPSPFHQFHNGIDIGHSNACVTGNCSIYATAPGRITDAFYSRTGGNMVIIDHSRDEKGKEIKFDGFPAGSRIITRSLHLRNFSKGSFQHRRLGPVETELKRGDMITLDGKIKGKRIVDWYYEEINNTYIRRNIEEIVQIRNDAEIGTMGTTGRSTGVHLHFDIKINGQFVNPTRLITVPADRPWVGKTCEKSPEVMAGLDSVLAVYARGEVEYYDPRKERFSPHLPPFSFKEKGNPFTAILRGNRFLAENCLLRPNDTYSWSVRACCGWDGTECGESSSWSMSTSDKVEKLTQGTEAGTSSDPEIIYRLEDANLRWCDKWFKGTATIDGKKQDVFLPPDRYEIEVEQRLPLFLFWQTWRAHPIVQARGGSIFQRVNPLLAKAPPTHVKNEEFFLFTKSDYANYRWRVRACREECGDWSPDRYLKVSDETIIDAPRLIHPSDDPQGNDAISWPVSFRWGISLGANSYQFEIYKENATHPFLRKAVESVPGIDGQITRTHEVILPKVTPKVDLELNTSYRWRVRSCWDTTAKDERFCEEKWSERRFKTTGRPPLFKSPTVDTVSASIPLRFEWERVPGAGSYRLKLNESEIVTPNNYWYWDGRYPIFKQDTTYAWSVRTCNDPEGKICYDKSSEIRNFQTLKLESPQNLMPPSADYSSEQYNKIDLSWDKVLGAHYYKLSISCEGTEIFSEITNQTRKSVPLTCVGDNNWTVKACIDERCEHFGLSSQGHFGVREGRTTGGFVPCGLDYNNPATPWNEREACRLSHLFKLLKIILDFLFWQLMPIVLVVMVAVSGLTFYLSLGNPDVITKIKAIWSSVGKGLLIMFFAWTAITIIMSIMGYTGIFGPWWQVSF